MITKIKVALLSLSLLILSACDETTSVLNFPGAVITDKSYIEGVYRFTILEYYPNGITPYMYDEIKVTKYEFTRYDIGDTIPGKRRN